MDPCGVLQTTLTLAPGASETVVVALGEGGERRGRAPARGGDPLARSRRRAAGGRGGVGAGAEHGPDPHPPDRSMDLLVNGWLIYQISPAACGRAPALPVRRRLRLPRPVAGRDGPRPLAPTCCASSCCAPRPAVPRRRRAALVAPAVGRGVRTRISDDYLWLPPAPPATCTRPATPGARRGGAPSSRALRSARGVEVLHAGPRGRDRPALRARARALAHGLRSGPARPAAHRARRLERRHEPRRRSQGRGESVWLAWFLCEVLREFAPLARARGDERVRAALRRRAPPASRNVEQAGWDGELVPPRVLRRRHAARVGRDAECRSTRSRRAGRCCPAR
jgi:cyclic beta-1,2-glucan synthetase